MHDPARVRTLCLALAPEDGSPLRAAIRAACPRFVSLAGLTAIDAATRIRREGVHILVDLVRARTSFLPRSHTHDPLTRPDRPYGRVAAGHICAAARRCPAGDERLHGQHGCSVSRVRVCGPDGCTAGRCGFVSRTAGVCATFRVCVRSQTGELLLSLSFSFSLGTKC
jgi:hypothetical protein